MNICVTKITIFLAVVFMFTLFTSQAVRANSNHVVADLTLTVTRGDDRNHANCAPGDCSLREAVNAANVTSFDDTVINFAPGLTNIELSDEIVIRNDINIFQNLMINGPGANILTINGGTGTNRIFYIHHGTVTILGTTLTGGNGTGTIHSGDGGAIFSGGDSSNPLLMLDGVYLTGNETNGVTREGGGVYFSGELVVVNSTVSANAATSCGGISAHGTLTIINSTISGNTTSGFGGGFCSGSGTTTLRNVTITNNHAIFGGGIYLMGNLPFSFSNTVVAGNTAGAPALQGSEFYFEEQTITSSGNNLVGDSPGDAADTGYDSAIIYQPSDILDVDPRFGVLQNNGGPTPTHLVLPGSPTIDNGSNDLVSPLASVFDQRGKGHPRIIDGNDDGMANVDIGALEVTPLLVASLEELYAAVNDPQNAGMQIIIAPGVYALSVNDPIGAARPNGGRLELQQDMSLIGFVGSRDAVVIDAANLPSSSYGGVVPNTGAIRLGKGTNSIEWLTIAHAVNGGAGIIAYLSAPETANIRIAHVTSTFNSRGIDVRNVGATSSAYVINADIVDNELSNSSAEGIRIINLQDANGGVITARLNGNRSFNNRDGMLLTNRQSNSGSISVTSNGDQFYQNADGTIILGGYSSGSIPANGNTVNFAATGTSFENNNGFSFFDLGGLVVVGGENASFPNGTSNNTVNIDLRGCRLANNQLHDMAAWGARSNPDSIGLPGMNNVVNIYLRGISPKFRIESFIDSVPDFPAGGNGVRFTGIRQ